MVSSGSAACGEVDVAVIDVADAVAVVSSLKICIVSVSDAAASKLEPVSKVNEWICAEYDPLLNSATLVPERVLKTLMIVPLFEAVASNVPVELRAITANSVL